MRFTASVALACLVVASTLGLVLGCTPQGQAQCPQAPDGAANARPADEVDEYIDSIMKKAHIPGAAVAIVRDGKVEKMATYGLANLEWDAKTAPDTAFQIASTTKVFTGTLLMRLVQEGRIGLADPISKHLPDAPDAWTTITVRHLAAHASGMKNDAVSLGLSSMTEAYEAARHAPMLYEPGERSEYGTTDFIVLAHILERITGQSFQELLQSRIFGPLGFSCTYFDNASENGQTRFGDLVPRRATVYRFTDDHQRRAWFLYPSYTYASGGAFSCIADLAKWAVGMDQGELLTPESQRIASNDFKLNSGKDAGYGVVFTTGRLRGLPIFGHSGGPALGDVVRVPDHKLTVIVVTNQQHLSPNIAPGIAAMFLPPLEALNDKGIEDKAPALTTELRKVLEQMPSGAIDAAPFASKAEKELLPFLRSLGPVQTAVYPPLSRVVLLEERKEGDARLRVYRAIYGKDTSLKWTFTLDEDGKILDMESESE